tara:strand:+ start:151 stop:1080 length:930 start_codon:yes stop_codon:yes gene_type:complete
MKSELKDKILSHKIVRKATSVLKTKTLPGFSNVPIYEVGRYFLIAVFKGTLPSRSASLAFNFFLAIFPAILFLLSLIPFIPLEDFYENLINNLNQILPSGIKEPVLQTLTDLVDHEREGVLVLNILLAFYFASNGIVNLMTEFNNTNLFKEKRVWWKKRLIALFLVVVLTILTFTAIILITSTQDIIQTFFSGSWLDDSMNWFFINIIRWITIIALFYLAISFLYYFGPAKRRNWKFFSVGSSTATVLVILTSLAFSFYVNYFSRYNAIYGSIGTIIIVLLYLQLNSFVLLLGFELNASIRKGKINLTK